MIKHRTGHAKPPMQPSSIWRAMTYVKRLRWQALLPYAFLLVATLSQLAVPNMVGRVIDAVSSGSIAGMALDALQNIPQSMLSAVLPRVLEFLNLPADWDMNQLNAHLTAQQEDAPNALLVAGISIVAFAVLQGLFSFLQAYWAERNSQGIAYDLRNDLYSKIQRLSFSYHDRNQTGQLMIRATDDVEKVRMFLGQGLIYLLSAAVLLSGTLIILFTTNAKLAVYTLWMLPVAVVLFAVFSGIIRPLFTKVQQKLSMLNTILQENLAGIRVIKAFTRESSEREKFSQAANDLMEQRLKVARTFIFMFPLIFLFANLGQASTLFFGGRQIIENTLTIGQWQEFSLYQVYLFLPIAQFGFIIIQLGQASASAQRIFEILDAQSEVSDKPGAKTLPKVKGLVNFEDVTFRYFGGGEPVLKSVNFEVKPGQSVALLGATGSGKTTIINLLPRFYDPSEGRISIDGHDLRDVTLESLRSQIGIVLQETTLFSGSIRENIAFGRPEASLQEVQAVAKAAAAHEFIVSFPDGYETRVGERGTTLSGGEKQRVAIARALLMDPRILILDDSTSSVDLATETQIQDALEKLMQGRTSFVIAQRITTVMQADLILVLDKGQIVAQGKHAELMEESEIYADIYSSQLLGDELMEMRA